MHRTLPALACLALLPTVAADVEVRAPAFTLNGSYTLWITSDQPIQAVDLELDTGQRTSLQNVNQSLATLTVQEVPDGLRSWHLQVQSDNGSRLLNGSFTAQDLTPILTAGGGDAAVLEALQAHEALLQGLQVPSDVARQGDLEGFATSGDVALVLARLSEQERLRGDVQDTRESVKALHAAGNHLALLLLLGVGLVVLYLHRVRSELRLNPEDRALLRAVAWRLQVTPESAEFKAALHQLGYQANPRPRHVSKAVKPRA